MHTSVALSSCEFINITKINPLISKCQIKVCYVGDEPNRNKSIITKDVARQMAETLPGSPIVGFYNEENKDFEEHNRELEIKDGNFSFVDTTKPYGFVDLNAKVWFQKFLDDGENEHEYLCTEGWLWTGQYPEASRIVERGNNQSMELDNKTIDAQWTKDDNGKPQFFIINEAIISKLCVLGEEFEPCFEGSNITNVQFSFNNEFKQELYSMVNELKDLLENKGGAQKMFTTYSVEIGDSLWEALYSYSEENNYKNIVAVLEDGEQKFAVLENEEGKMFRLDFSISEDNSYSFEEEVKEMEDYTPSEEPQFALEEVENYKKQQKKEEEEKSEDKDDKSDDSESDNKSEGENSSEDSSEDKESDDKEEKEDEEEKDKKKKKYSLEEIPEYVALSSEFETLNTNYSTLQSEYETLKEEVEGLRTFRLEAERKEKQAKIDEFYMLSDEDKKELVDNIDSYSLKDIESELCVMCYRKGVNFNEDKEEFENPTSYNLGGENYNDVTPAWIKMALEVEKEINN